MRLDQSWNFHDFRRLAKQRLPAPLFHYIDGAADDEATHRRNTAAFEDCDLVPNVLRGVEQVDLSVRAMGQRLAVPFYCSPTAAQRLFHHEGELAVARAAETHGTMFGCSSMGTTSIADLRQAAKTPQIYQFYFFKDRALNRAMMDSAKAAGVEVMMLTVDTITLGNREREVKHGYSVPFRLTPKSALAFALKPRWAINYMTHTRYRLPQLEAHVDLGTDAERMAHYARQMFDPSMNWDDAADMVRYWNGPFALKGIMSVGDARRAADIGCTGVVVSNHGGRQLDGSRSAFDQLAEIVDAVGNRIDVLMDGGVQRGTHILKALALGAKAVGIGRYYLYALTAAGRPGVERALGLLKAEIERDMKLMGVRKIGELGRENLRFR